MGNGRGGVGRGCGRKRKLPALNLAPGRTTPELRNPDAVPWPAEAEPCGAVACVPPPKWPPPPKCPPPPPACPPPPPCCAKATGVSSQAQASTPHATSINFLRIELRRTKRAIWVPSLQPPKQKLRGSRGFITPQSNPFGCRLQFVELAAARGRPLATHMEKA